MDSVIVPAVSVVMSVYNGEDYLAEAIDSILGQTFTDFEFIVIDDGSRDSTRQIVERYAQTDARIRLISQQNTGLTQALRNGVAEAKAPLIARMDADDISTPDRFQRQVDLLAARPDCVAATCHFVHFRDDGSIKMVSSSIGPEPLVPLYNSFCNRIGGHGQVMFRRAAYEQAGGYDPAVRYSEDYDLWSRLLLIGGFAIVEDVLYKWRVGHGGVTDKHKDALLDCAIRIACREHERLTGTQLDHATAMALINFWWARKPENTSMGDTVKASRAMSRAIRCFFEQNPKLAHMEREVRRSIMSNWQWRISLAGKANLARRALLLGHALYWRASALSAPATAPPATGTG